MPKYILLYKDLLKHTDIDHSDYKNIDYGYKKFCEINDDNNRNLD